MLKKTLFLLPLVFLFLNCHPKQKRAFYYWRTVFSLDSADNQFLQKNKIDVLYLRLFDVGWNQSKQYPEPQGVIKFNSSFPADIQLVPVVFLTNQSMLNIHPTKVEKLAKQIVAKVNQIVEMNHLNYSEIQIDCDWNKSSKDNYFRLLEAIKQKLQKNQQLSATIRLHQVKYDYITGVPPVDRGMLMYYNMGKISPQPNENSIYSYTEANKYVKSVEKYSLPLDVVVPYFSWVIQIRNGRVVELDSEVSEKDFLNSSNFKRVDSLFWVVEKPCFLNGNYFMQYDSLKLETISMNQTLQASQQLHQYLPVNDRTVAIYHYSDKILKDETILYQKVFSAFD